MNDEQGEHSLEDVFHRAAELTDFGERQAFLDQVCGDDALLRSRVEALLRHDADAGSFLEKPPEEIAAGRLEATAAGTNHGDDDAWKKLLEPVEAGDCQGRLGTYEVTEFVGRGGMGIVLRARDPKLHRAVAVKLLAPELAAQPVSVQRFLREARAAAAVSHDHVVSIYAIDDEARPPRIVMELIDGQSLQQKIDKTGSLDVKSILRIGMQTAGGLSAAHRQGLVHRDIKPANILLENGIEKVKLTDFGLARAVDDIGMTQTGQITGTPQYMSPEQAQGQRVDHRTDLFSLGCVLYAMCTGRAAFRADSAVAVLHRIVHDTPRPIRKFNDDIPEWLCAIVEKMLAKYPDDRFESAAEIEDLLGRWLAHLQQPDSVRKPETVAENERSATHAATEAAERETAAGTAIRSVPPGARFITRPVRCRLALLLIVLVWLIAIGDGLHLIRGITAEALGLGLSLLTGLYLVTWGLLSGISALLRRRTLSEVERSQLLRRGVFFGGLLVATGVFVSQWCGVDDSDDLFEKWKDFTSHGAIRFKLESDRTRVEFNGNVLNEDGKSKGHRQNFTLWLSEPGEYQVRTILTSGGSGVNALTTHQGSHSLIHADKDVARIAVTGPLVTSARRTANLSSHVLRIARFPLMTDVVAVVISQQATPPW